MRMRLTPVIALVLVVTACGAAETGRSGAASVEPVVEGVVARCDEVPTIHAPDEWYRDEPVYVGNEMPVAEVQAWAAGQPGFEEVWIDRDRRGWIAVAFSQDAQARQADLQAAFPGVGVVAVPVDWTKAELVAVQDRVLEELRGSGDLGSGISVTQGVVAIGFGVLTEERLAAVEDAFAGERVCVEGADPAGLPVEGPQQTSGDGWRLLADEPEVGLPYRTGLATDETSYQALWAAIGLAAERPAVDFDAQIVIWFGAVYGSSCPDLRLDDVVVDRDRALVHAEIIILGQPLGCTDDANARAYVVALDRARLVPGPFAIQLGAEDPPAGVPEERTLVAADLSVPGAVAAADAVGQDPALAEPSGARSGDIIETGYPWTYRMDARCGTEWLGVLNGVAWRREVPAGSELVPDPWRAAVADDGTLQLEVTIEPGSPPTATAVENGHLVVYEPADEPPPPC